MNKFLVVFAVCVTGVLCEIEPSDLRIIGGHPINITDANYQVIITVRPSANSTTFRQCGGTLIENNLVLTSGWCLSAENGTSLPTNVRVFAGHENMSESNNSSDAEWVKIHEDFSSVGIMRNDIGLIKLRSPFSLSNDINKISFSRATIATPVGTNCSTTGWGATLQNPSSQELQRVYVSVSSLAECNSTYIIESTISVTLVHNTSLCAGGYASATDTCTGDYGGPLVCNGSLVGISSTSTCGVLPGIYTDVRQFAAWIDANGSAQLSTIFLLTIMMPIITYFAGIKY